MHCKYNNMRSIALIFAFIAQAYAEKDLADMVMEKLVTKLVDHLETTDMDNTVLGKPAGAATLPRVQPSAMRPVLPKNTILGCPVSRTSGVAHADVKLGSDSGGLVFVPDKVSIKAGEKVTWTNNAGFPHNIVFDEDNVPDGVNADSLSREDYLNAPGETYSVTFDKAGTYGYYCEPHRGAGMQGTVVVN